MLASAFSLIIFIIGFGFLVFVHELGHFLVAKWVGIRATQFAIGFGPAIASFRKGVGFVVGGSEATYYKRAIAQLKAEGVRPDPDKLKEKDSDQYIAGYDREAVLAAADKLGLGETEYRLNYVPLGGYVKMLGQEDLNPASASQDPRAYNQKPIWARACVISAGVVMNMIFGLIFFIIAFMWGVLFPAPEVGGVVPSLPAAETYAQGHEDEPAYKGLQVGDVITHVDDKQVDDFLEASLEIALSSGNRPVELTVERPGEKKPLNYAMVPERDERTGLLSVGIAPSSTLRVGRVEAGSSADESDIEPGMVVTHVAEQPINQFHAYHDAIVSARGLSVDVTLADEKTGETVTTSQQAMPLLTREDEKTPPHLLGFVPALEVTHVVEGSAAEWAGVEVGDILVRIGNVDWPVTAKQVSQGVASGGGNAINLALLRNGQLINIPGIKPGKTGVMGMGDPFLGIATFRAFDDRIFARILPDTPADRLQEQGKLPGGSSILRLNGIPINSWHDLQRIAQNVARETAEDQDKSINVMVNPNMAGGSLIDRQFTVDAASLEQVAEANWTLPTDLGFKTKNITLAGANPVSATVLGLEKTHQYMTQTYLTLFRLIQGTVPPDQLRGPVGIVEVGAAVTRESFSKFLFLLGLISVNLAVLNFLPIPIVDGGHIVFLIYEKIKGTPPGEKIQTASLILGLALIGTVFIFVTYNDIARLIVGS